jgi:hypothetical protein
MRKSFVANKSLMCLHKKTFFFEKYICFFHFYTGVELKFLILYPENGILYFVFAFC